MLIMEMIICQHRIRHVIIIITSILLFSKLRLTIINKSNLRWIVLKFTLLLSRNTNHNARSNSISIYVSVEDTWFMRRSTNTMESSRQQLNNVFRSVPSKKKFISRKWRYKMFMRIKPVIITIEILLLFSLSF